MILSGLNARLIEMLQVSETLIVDLKLSPAYIVHRGCQIIKQFIMWIKGWGFYIGNVAKELTDTVLNCGDGPSNTGSVVCQP